LKLFRIGGLRRYSTSFEQEKWFGNFFLTRVFILFFFLFSFYGLCQNTSLKKIEAYGFKRLYQLNDSVYRSEQPSSKRFQQLQDLGIKTSISFRRKKDDRKKAKGTKLELVHIPLKTKGLNENDLIKALKAIQNAKKPVLVHCWHGSDRTGAIMAAYRVVFEDWSKKKAIQELRRVELGYHENWYPNVIDLISGLNVNRIRKELSP